MDELLSILDGGGTFLMWTRVGNRLSEPWRAARDTSRTLEALREALGLEEELQPDHPDG